MTRSGKQCVSRTVAGSQKRRTRIECLKNVPIGALQVYAIAATKSAHSQAVRP